MVIPSTLRRKPHWIGAQLEVRVQRQVSPARTHLPSPVSVATSTIRLSDRRSPVNEAHFAEIEKTLLYISEARERAARSAKALRADDADAHLVEALAAAEVELADLHRRLLQATHFAVPKPQLTL